ncbi:hypothetical protein CDA63_06070 [Hymenobacter amundsenii]|uniref:Asparagine synthetase B n=1 Tax=Hymenobacter amundsenii TaxID=2006685 RepID=A0A246FMR1_9BACT|nr:DUF2911 domain-containing protein [Hymenobacter amundsenii]OWP64028.1 hypothetical protein CDA63_06070 [Hymenobacter amundsenii]
MPALRPLPLRIFLAPLLGAALLLSACSEQTPQSPKEKTTRPSPPATVSTTVPSGATLTIRYSRPSANERKVFGGLVPYGQVWRTGANEATTFAVDKPVTVQGKPLPAGKYALFTIPAEKEWTIIFNKTPNQWGAYEYEPAQDTLRVPAQPTQVAKRVEQFTITTNSTGQVTMAWENTQVTFAVK